MFFKAILKFYFVLVFFIKAILKFQLFFSKWTIRILVLVTISKYSKQKYIFSFSLTKTTLFKMPPKGLEW